MSSGSDTKLRREVAVYCGDVVRPTGKQSGDLILDVEARPGDPSRVNLEAEHITRPMVAEMPDRLADLLEIACYVHCADQFSRRDSAQMPRMGSNWRRAFRFRIAVRDPEFWNSPDVQQQLVSTLGFLSEDAYAFEFTKSTRPAGEQRYLDLTGDGPPSGFSPEAVIPFSGGLDSFAGVAEAVLARQVPVILVSHHSSHLVSAVQAELVRALRQRAGADRVLHISVTINKGGEEAVEFTQRTRSFLFASLGFVVAHLFQRREVTFFENGIVSLNLPLAGHVLGSRATRTTHPRVLHDFGTLFSLVAGRDARVINPFFWQTKADVVRRIAEVGCASLIPQTFSCTRVRAATRLRRRHCGVCSQCVDRRFGVLAADCGRFEPAEFYNVDLFRGEREPGPDAVMVESYVLAAHRYAQSNEAAFLDAHGEVFRALPYLDLPQGEAASRLHRLHVRHGQAVVDVVTAQRSVRDAVADRLALPDSSLLAMIQAPAAQDIELIDPVEAEPPTSEQVRTSDRRAVSRPLTFALDTQEGRVIFDGGVVLSGAMYRLVEALMPAFHDGLRASRGAGGFGYVKSEQLARDLGVETATLRQSVRRLRAFVAQQFHDKRGVAVSDDDVIQNDPWHGYRLSPFLALLPTLIEAADK